MFNFKDIYLFYALEMKKACRTTTPSYVSLIYTVGPGIYFDYTSNDPALGNDELWTSLKLSDSHLSSSLDTLELNVCGKPSIFASIHNILVLTMLLKEIFI